MHINCYEQTSHLHASRLQASRLHASRLHARRLQSIHIKKESSPVKEKTLSGCFIPGCRRSARLPQSSLRYMASPKLKKR